MNKKNIFGALALATVAAFAMTSCDKSKCQVDEKKVEGKQAVPSDVKIAYVEVDSIMSQYKFCKDYSLILQKKGQNIQNTLAQKQRALEQAYMNFQQKIQQNAYTREQAEQIQMSLQKQNSDLRDSIQHFLAVYNKDKKFGLILSKAGDNLLYADKAYDITNEVIAGLNKAYKPAAPVKEEKAAAKKK